MKASNTVIALLLRRDALGYLVAFSLLVLEVMLAPMIAAQTVSQRSAGIAFSMGAIVGPIMGFVILALVAGWMLVLVLHSIAPSPTKQPAALQAAHA